MFAYVGLPQNLKDLTRARKARERGERGRERERDKRLRATGHARGHTLGYLGGGNRHSLASTSSILLYLSTRVVNFYRVKASVSSTFAAFQYPCRQLLLWCNFFRDRSRVFQRPRPNCTLTSSDSRSRRACTTQCRPLCTLDTDTTLFKISTIGTCLGIIRTIGPSLDLRIFSVDSSVPAPSSLDCVPNKTC